MLAFVKYWKVFAALGLIALVWFKGVSYGEDRLKAEYITQIESIQTEQSNLADELAQARDQLRTKTQTKVRTIYVEADPTGCADTDVPDGMLDAIRDRTDRPTTD